MTRPNKKPNNTFPPFYLVRRLSKTNNWRTNLFTLSRSYCLTLTFVPTTPPRHWRCRHPSRRRRRPSRRRRRPFRRRHRPSRRCRDSPPTSLFFLSRSFFSLTQVQFFSLTQVQFFLPHAASVFSPSRSLCFFSLFYFSLTVLRRLYTAPVFIFCLKKKNGIKWKREWSWAEDRSCMESLHFYWWENKKSEM